MGIWEWLLSMLDSRMAIFVTRATTEGVPPLHASSRVAS